MSWLNNWLYGGETMTAIQLVRRLKRGEQWVWVVEFKRVISGGQE